MDSSSSLYIYIFPLRIVLILIANIYVVAKDLFSKLRLFIVWQIDACNGFYCENYKPNQVYKPKMWTEVWTGW